jgi:lysozyme family protein
MSRATFDRAMSLVLQFEGNRSDDPDDPGGRTRFGVTQATYNAYRAIRGKPSQSVDLMSQEELADIYWTQFWLAGFCHILPPPVAIAHFDACVNLGVEPAAKLLQAAVGAKVDGAIGPLTMQLVARHEPRHLAARIIACRSGYYVRLAVENPRLQKFLPGWLKRLGELEVSCNRE